MKSIAQFFRAEWREYRGTLFGLWAASVVLILVAFFTGAQKYVTDPFSPAAFACLGYLGFALAVLPRVFRSEAKDPQRTFLSRTPGGRNHSFFGKFLFVYAGLLLTALIPMVFTTGLMYFQATANFQTLMATKGDSLGYAMVAVYSHAVALLLIAWGLPFRWLLLAVPLGLALVYAAYDVAYSSMDFAFADPALGTALFCAALFLGPWMLSWFAYSAPKGMTHLRRCGFATFWLGVGLAPAWGIGLVGAFHQIQHASRFDPKSHAFQFDDPYLSSNGRYVYSSVRTYAPDLPRALWLPHAIRIDLTDGSVMGYGLGNFLQPSPEGTRHHDGSKLPGVHELLRLDLAPPLLRMFGPDSTGWLVETDSSQESPLDRATVAESMVPNARAYGLPDSWCVDPTAVGLGVSLATLGGSHRRDCALFDSSRNLVFQSKELPLEVRRAVGGLSFKILPGPWLAAPSERGNPFWLYDPETKSLTPSSTLTGDDVIGPALLDGHVLVRVGADFALYDSASDSMATLESVGTAVPLPRHDRKDNRMVQELFARYSIANTDGLKPRLALYDVRTVENPNGPMDRYLGWIDADQDSIRWFPWTGQNRTFGLQDDHTIVYTSEEHRIFRMDLGTGEQTLLFPVPR